LNLTFSPLAGILAAGNRCMIKPSEFTPATSALLGQLIADYFDPTEVCVTTGGAEVGAAFCSLPFDHLLFTGAASIAKHVVRATAENLVPVTLELGGKCPVIIGRSVDLARAADSILAGKMLNSGQTCIAPDHVFVPENRTTEFTDVLRNAANRMFPTMLTNPDYGAIINQQHFRRLEAVLADAERGGSRLIALHPEQEDFDKQVSREKKFPPTLIVEPDKDSLAMQDEIFGPILPIISYGDLDQVIGSISSMPHPLALYYFGNDSAEQKSVR
jgi:coniferyl-aldehyde dehydrogenase